MNNGAQTSVNGLRLVINDLNISVTQVSERWNCHVKYELLHSVRVFDIKARLVYKIVEMVHESFGSSLEGICLNYKNILLVA